MVDQWYQVVAGINRVARFSWKNDFYWVNVFVDLKDQNMSITRFYTYVFVDGRFRLKDVPKSKDSEILKNLRNMSN